MEMLTVKRLVISLAVIAGIALVLAFAYRRSKSSKEVWSEAEGAQSTQATPAPATHSPSLRESLEPGKGREIPSIQLTWADLTALDYKTGLAPDKIKQLELAPTVKIPGYIVPLTDDFVPFDEFLIVPDAMACIHAPPPPPNQMLYVKTKKPLPIELTYQPLWFYGKLSVTKTESFYGSVGYLLKLQRLEIYKTNEESTQ